MDCMWFLSIEGAVSTKTSASASANEKRQVFRSNCHKNRNKSVYKLAGVAVVPLGIKTPSFTTSFRQFLQFLVSHVPLFIFENNNKPTWRRRN